MRPDLELDIDNCQALCPGCHLAKSRAEAGVRVLSPERLAWRKLVEEELKSLPSRPTEEAQGRG